MTQDAELAAKDVEICNLKSVIQSEARKARETLTGELKLRDEVHAAELLRKDASLASILSRKDAELAEMGGRLAKAKKVAALQEKLDAIKALLGPDAAPVDPSRVADILSAAGGGQAADE